MFAAWLTPPQARPQVSGLSPEPPTWTRASSTLRSIAAGAGLDPSCTEAMWPRANASVSGQVPAGG